MVGHPAYGYIPPAKAHNPLHHTDILIFPVEDAPLFNVQFHKGCHAAFWPDDFGEAGGVSAQPLNSLTHGVACTVHHPKGFWFKGPCQGAAAHHPAFFIRKYNDLQGVICFNTPVM